MSRTHFYTPIYYQSHGWYYFIPAREYSRLFNNPIGTDKCVGPFPNEDEAREQANATRIRIKYEDVRV